MPARQRRPRPPGLGIGEGLRRHAELLLDQQMWCWGRDIRHPDGNLLLRRGFAACRPPAGTVGSSAYAMDLPGGPRLTLWGFGLCLGTPGDGLVYLGRSRFRPTWRPEPDLPGPAWDATRLPRFRDPRGDDEWDRARRLIVGILEALGDYEEWALATAGPDHRRACVGSWTKPRTAPARVAPSWRSLGRRVGRPARSA